MELDIQTLREERAKVKAEADRLLVTAEKEKRGMTAEENHKHNELYAEFDKFCDQIDLLEKKEQSKRADEVLNKSYRKTAPDRFTPESRLAPGDAVRSWFSRKNTYGMTHDELENMARCGIDPHSNTFKLGIRNTTKASGGTGLVQWTEFTSKFDEALKWYGKTRNLVTVLKTETGQNLPYPTVDDTANVATIVSEAGAVSAVDMSTNYVTLGSYKLNSGEVPLSLELIRDSSVPIEDLVVRSIYTRFARAFEKYIVSGTGSSQPNGLLARASSASVVLGGTAASPSITVAKIFDLLDSIDLAYQDAPGFGFLMHPTVLTMIRKLTDSTGQPIYQTDFRSGAPGTLLGFPVYQSAYMNATGSAVNVPMILAGDYSHYVWREIGEIEVHRLDQVRMLNGLVSYVAFMRADGNLLNTNAVKYIANPAS